MSYIQSTLAEACHAGQDLVGGLGPYEGLGVFVGGVQVAVDGSLQFRLYPAELALLVGSLMFLGIGVGTCIYETADPPCGRYLGPPPEKVIEDEVRCLTDAIMHCQRAYGFGLCYYVEE